jgi:hypothetical protein
VHALVVTGGGTVREDEERAALAELCAPARLELTELDLPDGRLPAHWAAVREAVTALRERLEADLVFAPIAGPSSGRRDRHEGARASRALTVLTGKGHAIAKSGSSWRTAMSSLGSCAVDAVADIGGLRQRVETVQHPRRHVEVGELDVIEADLHPPAEGRGVGRMSIAVSSTAPFAQRTSFASPSRTGRADRGRRRAGSGTASPGLCAIFGAGDLGVEGSREQAALVVLRRWPEHPPGSSVWITCT